MGSSPDRCPIQGWSKPRRYRCLSCQPLSPDGTLLGYGAIRPAARAWRVGPLFARTVDLARTLFIALVAETGGQPFCFDAPEANADAVALAREFGLEAFFSTARMYTKSRPQIDVAGIYGLTSLELG